MLEPEALQAVVVLRRRFIFWTKSSPVPRLVAVVAVAFALYVQTLGFGFSYLDDDILILEAQGFLTQPSSMLRSFARPYFPPAGHDHAYYRPLVTASFAFDAQRSGSDPRGYRVTNLVLHALAAALLFLLLRRLGHGDGIALLGGLVLAVHPALVDAVAWIPGRNDSLLAVCVLASWLCLASARAPGRWGLRLGHLLAWLLALFAKETAIVMPIVYVACARMVDRRAWRDLVAPWMLVGWGAVIGVYAGARAAALPDRMGIAGLTVGSLVGAPRVLVGSLGKLVIPVHLSVLAIPEDTWLWPGLLAAALLLAAVFVPGVRRGRLAFALLGLMAFVAASLPASNLLVLENRLYLPALAVVLAASELAGVVRGPTIMKVAGAVTLLALLAAGAFLYSEDFRDRMAFSRAAVRGSPHSALAHRNLGIAYQVQGDTEAARREYEAALLEDAAEPVVHNNLGVIFMAQGNLAGAERQLRDELTINAHDANAHLNLARVLRAAGRDDEAAPHWEASLGLGAADTEVLWALVAYYGPRDPARAAQFSALLEGRAGTSSGP